MADRCPSCAVLEEERDRARGAEIPLPLLRFVEDGEVGDILAARVNNRHKVMRMLIVDITFDDGGRVGITGLDRILAEADVVETVIDRPAAAEPDSRFSLLEVD